MISLTWLALLTTASAQVLESVSFGHVHPISPNGRALPGWHLSGEKHQVQLLSDRIILTPPVPGNTRGALWSDSTAPSTEWTVAFEFRASGQEQSSGNLNLWFTQDKGNVGTNSVYTVENFDGLGLVIDQYGGTGGKIRAFLNDGTQNFRSNPSLESLAFGLCDYSYRNLGRPSKLTITHKNGLAVSVDDRECFRTDRVSLPPGYYFGITAATADNPDSFEVNKFVVSSLSPSQQSPPSPPVQQQQDGQAPPLQRMDRFPGSPEAVPDEAADKFKSQSEQFADLHNRLQGMTHQVANIFRDFDTLSRKMEEGFGQVMGAISPAGSQKDVANSQSAGQQQAAIQALTAKIESIENTVQQIKKDVEGRDYGRHLDEIRGGLDSLKGGLTDHLPETLSHVVKAAAPKLGVFLFILLAVQIIFAGAYIVYKRRRNSMPKKYL